LFADGSAALLVEGSTHSKKRLLLESFHSDLALDGEHDMAWSIGDLGFEMKLTAYIPRIIKGGIRTLTEALLKKNNISLEKVRYFALHPGGVKILEAIEQALAIPREKNDFSYRVLRNFGNMSSPTVIFVLNGIFTSIRREDNQQPILSLAFGPGLTLESMILKIEVD
jgi:predicted naringenin-chalcone synthase